MDKVLFQAAQTLTVLYNDHFKPEITTTFETGFEIRMLHNRLTADALSMRVAQKIKLLIFQWIFQQAIAVRF